MSMSMSMQLLCYKTYFVGTTMLHIRFCWQYDATNHIWLQQGHVTTHMLLELLYHKSYFVGATIIFLELLWGKSCVVFRNLVNRVVLL